MNYELRMMNRAHPLAPSRGRGIFLFIPFTGGNTALTPGCVLVALISCALSREGAFAGLFAAKPPYSRGRICRACALRAKARDFKDFNDNKGFKDARREIKRDKSDKRDKGTREKGRVSPSWYTPRRA